MGASLLAITVCQATGFLSDRPPSRAGSLPQGIQGVFENAASRQAAPVLRRKPHPARPDV
ncbi:hypothetical protein DBR45_15755 [Pseudomonas sp. HMWF031]|nr:hypothetical protein DBR45_15755 [Pseudomonas sp. HMWF031]